MVHREHRGGLGGSVTGLLARLARLVRGVRDGEEVRVQLDFIQSMVPLEILEKPVQQELDRLARPAWRMPVLQDLLEPWELRDPLEKPVRWVHLLWVRQARQVVQVQLGQLDESDMPPTPEHLPSEL